MVAERALANELAAAQANKAMDEPQEGILEGMRGIVKTLADAQETALVMASANEPTASQADNRRTNWRWKQQASEIAPAGHGTQGVIQEGMRGVSRHQRMRQSAPAVAPANEPANQRRRKRTSQRTRQR